MLREIDLSKKPKKSLLKKSTGERKKSNKTIQWDWETIEAQQLDMKLNPPLMRIEEPKTPYDPYEKEDCAYLEKVRRMFRVQPTVKNIFFLIFFIFSKYIFQQEVLDDVTRELEKIPVRKNSNENLNKELVDIETIDNEGKINIEKISKEHRDNIEFLKKRKIAYENEFVQGENFVEKGLEEKYKGNNNIELSEEDKREIELDDRTLKNTIINKFSHIILKKEKYLNMNRKELMDEISKLNENKEKKKENNNDLKKEDDKKENNKVDEEKKSDEKKIDEENVKDNNDNEKKEENQK